MATDLTRISEKARREPELVFTSLYHHISDVDNLRACYEALDANKAAGVDGMAKAQYGENLEENLLDLSARLKRMGYRRDQSSRRCCRTSTCTMCWTCGSAGECAGQVQAKRIISALPMTF